MRSDKEVYRRLRVLTCDQLWQDEVPRFERATAQERVAGVALVRAVGVVFSESGSAAQKAEARAWLLKLLQDPSEKVRRYAMTALPKLGGDAAGEAEVLSVLKRTTVDREKKFAGRALDKIGGRATLAALGEVSGLSPRTEQKVKASLARAEDPSTLPLDRPLADFAGLSIHLRCRKGLEQILRGEVEEWIAQGARFRLGAVSSRQVQLEPLAPFSLQDLYQLRCFATVGFGLGTVKGTDPAKCIDALAEHIGSPRAAQLLAAFTQGSIRYRIEFVGRGHQRGAVSLLANRVYALRPELLNDARSAPWSMDVHPTGQGLAVELRPRLTPDPRFYYRTDDIPAASHPPLAACLARLAGRVEGDVVWDPFCGSGLELVERALRGGVVAVCGTDLSPEAVAIARVNFAAARLPGLHGTFVCTDFRDHAALPGLGPRSVSLVITNPPMGRRVRVHDLRGLMSTLLRVASTVLKPGGRLVFPNPVRLESADPSLSLESRQPVDLGGFLCWLEVYRKGVGAAPPPAARAPVQAKAKPDRREGRVPFYAPVARRRRDGAK